MILKPVYEIRFVFVNLKCESRTIMLSLVTVLNILCVTLFLTLIHEAQKCDVRHNT